MITFATSLFSISQFDKELPPDQFVVGYVQPEDAKRASLQLSIFEQLLKADIQRSAHTREVCFISFGFDPKGRWIDPPLDFLERFQSVPYSVRPVSEARLPREFEMESQHRARGVEDPATGNRTHVFYVQINEWLDDSTVRVKKGIYGGPLSGGGVNGAIYHFNGRHWIEIDHGQHWIS